jgi:hypothetical protein
MLFICTDLHQLNTYFFEEVEFVSKFLNFFLLLKLKELQTSVKFTATLKKISMMDLGSMLVTAIVWVVTKRS